jgi:hypothetical protein
MATFQLKTDTNTLDFDITGAVLESGAAFGNWSTNGTNQIVITKPDSTTVAIDATWKFNGDNHLILQSGGADAFDFCSSDTAPFFKTVDATLRVFPDQNATFAFDLNGEWDIDRNHNLTFTANGTVSTIDGFVQDPRGRFMYHFFDQQDLTRESVLGFVGEWESSTDTDGKPMVRFNYKRADGTTDTFELPAAVTVNRTINQFMYEYDKKGQKRRLQFVGELKINENFDITYSLDRQVSQTGQEQVASTTFRFGATFHRNDFTGDLELVIAKADGSAGSTTITVGGNFTAMLGTAQLMVGFSFTQIRSGATVTSSVGFNGTLRFKDNGEINWEFQRNATQMTININAQLQVGDARVDGRLNLVSESGRVVGVKVLLGVAF